MNGEHPIRSKAELTDVWTARLHQSRAVYDSAVSRFREVLADQHKGLMPAPDGSQAVRNARLQESAARNEHMRILRIFTELVVAGKIPEDD
jgi:hypothetical protein